MRSKPVPRTRSRNHRVSGPVLSLLCLVAGGVVWNGPAQAEGAPADAALLPFASDPNPSTYQPFPREDALIVGATVLDGTGQRMDRADVLVQDGKVVSVSPDLEAPPGVAVLDAGGKWLTPGVIDIHSHDGTYVLPLTSQDYAVWDVSEVSSPNVAQIRIEDGIDVQDISFGRALAAGVTTIQVLPGSVPLFGGRSVVLKPVPAQTVYQMKFPGAPQGLKMSCGENPKSHFGESGQSPTSRSGEVAVVRAAFLEAAEYLKRWEAHVQNPAAVEAPKRDLALDTLAGVLHGDVRVHLHCYRADDIAVMLGVAREFGFRIAAIHHAAEAYKIPDLLRQNDVCAAVWSDWWGYKLEASDAIRSNAALLENAGVCTAMHSDSPVLGQRLNIEASKALGAGRRAGIAIPPEQAIRWLTANPARALGLDDRIGRVAPGYNADLVIWSGNPFSIYSRAEQVYVDGSLLYRASATASLRRSDKELGLPVLEGRP